MAELVAGGCGDWDAIEARWDLARYAAMQRHWTQIAPPAHIALAALIGFKPRRSSHGAGAVVDDPDELVRQLRAMGVM
jgi:hypothetical protein